MFYRVERIYKNWDEIYPEISASGVVSLCQLLNIMFILPLIMDIKVNNWLVIIITIFLIIFNGCYTFSSEKRKMFVDRWNNERASKRRLRGFLIIAYIIVSIVLFICALGWYSGYSNWEWEF